MTQKYIGQITDTSTESGDDLADRLNDFDNAHRTNQSGATRPAGALAGAIWTRVVAGVYDLMMFNGTKDVAVLTGDGNLAGLTDTEAAQVNLGLGTAAVVDHGTAPGQVPLNSDLGTMAVEEATDYVPQSDKASTIEAQAGVNNTKWMTPARVREALVGQDATTGKEWVPVATLSIDTKYQNSTGRTAFFQIRRNINGWCHVRLSADGTGVLTSWELFGITELSDAVIIPIPADWYYGFSDNPPTSVNMLAAL